MILADGIIGQMMEPVEFHEHAKRELPAKDWAATGWDPKSGRPRAIVNSLYIEVDELQELNDRLQARYAIIREKEARAELYQECLGAAERRSHSARCSGKPQR